MMDYFYAGHDQRDAKQAASSKQADEEIIPMLNVIDKRTLAQGTLMADKTVNEYKVKFVTLLLERWGHGVVTLQTDNEPAILALAKLIKDARLSATILRGTPEYSHASAGLVEGANGLAAGLLRAYRFALEAKLGVKVTSKHPLVPFIVMAIGWFITRFQPRDHGRSSSKALYGKEYAGEIAEL